MMKMNELVGEFHVILSNEEASVLENVQDVLPLDAYSEREQVVIENLIRKGLVSKSIYRGRTLVTRNEV